MTDRKQVPSIYIRHTCTTIQLISEMMVLVDGQPYCNCNDSQVILLTVIVMVQGVKWEDTSKKEEKRTFFPEKEDKKRTFFH